MTCRRCQHTRDAHRHLHASTYCGTCECPAYKPWWRFWVR